MKKSFKILAVVAVLAVASLYSVSKNKAYANLKDPCIHEKEDCSYYNYITDKIVFVPDSKE